MYAVKPVDIVFVFGNTRTKRLRQNLFIPIVLWDHTHPETRTSRGITFVFEKIVIENNCFETSAYCIVGIRYL